MSKFIIKKIGLGLATFVLVLGFSTSALAAVTPNSITVDSNTTTTLPYGGSLSITTSMTTVGSNWKGTKYIIGNSGPLTECADTGNHIINGTFTETFAVGPVLMTPGTYSVIARGNAQNDCGAPNDGPTLTLSNSVTVTKAPQSIAFPAIAGMTYGDPSFGLTATVSSPAPSPNSGLPITYTSTTTDVCTVAGSTVTLIGAGTCSIDATQGGNTNYNAATPVTQSFVVAQKILTPSATVSNKVYDGTNSLPVTISLAGVVGVDDVSATATATFTDKHVANGKAVTVSGISLAGVDASKYTLSTTTLNTTANITQLPLAVTAAVSSKIYDGNTISSILPVFGGIPMGDIATFIQSYVTETVGIGNKLVFPGGIVNDGNGGNNYAITFANNSTSTISAKELTLSGVTADEKTYSGNNLATLDCATASLTGVVSGDTVGFDCTGATSTFGDENVGSAKAVTVSGITLTGADAGNYTLTQPTGITANIIPAEISVTGDFAKPNKVYDATTAAEFRNNIANMNIDLTGVVLGDSVSLNLGSGTLAQSNVGTDVVVVFSGFGLVGGDAANYVLSAQPADETQNITIRSITISAQTDSKTYDGTTVSTPLPVVTSGSLAGTDSIAATQAFLTQAVGINKVLVPTGVINDGNGGANYNATWATVSNGVISPKTLTVTVAAEDKVYDSNRNATVTLSDDHIMGEDITISYSNAKFGNKKADPTKTVTVSGLTLSGPDAGNYVLGDTTATDTTAAITPRPLAITANATNKVYDGNTTAGISGYTTDVLAGDTIGSVAAVSANFDTKHVGTSKTVTIVPSLTAGADNDNYQLPANVTTTANITARTLTATATGVNKAFDGTTTATVTISTDHLLGDDVTGTYTSATFDTADIGTGKTVTVNGLGVTGAEALNYVTLPTSTTTSANITTAGLSVVANNLSKELDQPDPVFTFTPTGLFGTDTLSGLLTRETGETLGTYAITQGSLASSSNYSLMFTPGVLTITKKSQTITIDPIATVDFGTPDFTVVTNASSGLPVSISAAPAGVCTLSGNMLHVVNLGTCTITANQAGDMVYAAAPAATLVFAISDTSGPTITLNGLADQTIEVQTGTYAELGATATDNHYSGAVPVVTSGSVDTNITGDYTITYSATDDNMNISSVTRTVRVVDTTNPIMVLNGTANVSVLTGDMYVELGATAIDAYDGPLTEVITGSVDTMTPGTYTLTYSASDASGNPATPVTRTVTVSDAMAPVINTITPSSFEATGPSGATVVYGAIDATDAVDGTLPASCSPSSGSTFPVGVNTVTCEATNAHSITGYGSFTVTVTDSVDPIITVPESQTFEATGAVTTPTLMMATATDAVDPSPAVTYTPSSFSLGSHTVTWVAEDASGNTATATSTVVITDTTDPAISEHANVYATATSPSGAVVTYALPEATDLVDSEVTVVCTPASGSTFPRNGRRMRVESFMGGTTVTCTATDESGNSSTTTFQVIVSDEGSPVITLNGSASMSIAQGSTFTDPGSVVTDDVDTGLVATVTGSVNTSVPGTYTLTYNAVDSSMNNAVAVTRTITVTPVSSGGGGGGGSSSGISSGVVTATVKKTTCPVTTKYWDIGDRNNEIKKIQLFLNEYEGENLKITRIYNIETFQAVKRFQVKYADKTLTPWGLTPAEATGFWYMATARQANAIAGCSVEKLVLPTGKTVE